MTSNLLDPASTETRIDGRIDRRLRNREAVLEATIKMFSEGEVIPAMDVVAERAAVSLRSVYRYFETRDELIRAALEQWLLQEAPHLVAQPPIEGDLAERIEYFCGQRLTLYFRFAPLARVALVLDETDPLVRDLFDYGRDSLREQFAAQFETELGLLGHRDWEMATTAATLPLQFHLFEYMHVGCGFDATEMHKLIVEQLQLHLSAL
ncbi:MAG: AcrR family transcriptional regulator [Candidatus Azotimanducaceae bacterium]|jgi:AcrR family transcriptional regulator